MVLDQQLIPFICHRLGMYVAREKGNESFHCCWFWLLLIDTSWFVKFWMEIEFPRPGWIRVKLICLLHPQCADSGLLPITSTLYFQLVKLFKPVPTKCWVPSPRKMSLSFLCSADAVRGWGGERKVHLAGMARRGFKGFTVPQKKQVQSQVTQN